MQHPVDGRSWKKFDTKYPNFAKEPRNVRLGLAADGFNPFGNLNQAYKALEGGPIRPRWMFPFERFMKKLKGYVRNKAKPEADVARGHGGDGGGDDRPPSHQVPTGYGGCLGNRGKGTRKPNLDGSKADRLHIRQETWNLGLKKITDQHGPVLILFKWNDRETLMPLGDHAAHWANYLGSSLGSCRCTTLLGARSRRSGRRGSWQRLGSTLFDLQAAHGFLRLDRDHRRHHLHLQKHYNTNKALSRPSNWKADHNHRIYNWLIRRARPEEITAAEWDKHASDTQEYPSLIDTFWRTHELLIVGPTSSLGIIAGERIPHEASPASIPQRHVAGETYPQRHVAGESPDMSPGKQAIVVVRFEQVILKSKDENEDSLFCDHGFRFIV
ncbi:F-box domain containing protein [Tanacetum coccineum]